jgi:hypothetical protein
MVETGLNILGLLFTGIGASIAARAVIISENQVSLLSGPQSHGNKELGDALVRQSRSAQKGLLCVVVGAGLQMAALIYGLLVSQAHAAVRFVTG